jgi:hypothetical protein
MVAKIRALVSAAAECIEDHPLPAPALGLDLVGPARCRSERGNTPMQLSDTQTALLSIAIARADRMAFPVTLPIKGGAVGNVLRSLLRRGLLEEIPAADDQTIWRCDEAGQPVTLRASAAGILLLSGTVEQETQIEQRSVEQPVSAPRRSGTAQEAMLGLLRRAEGATIADMQAATGWQPHSVRGALSGVVAKKLGHTVVSTKEERARVYRIAD